MKCKVKESVKTGILTVLFIILAMEIVTLGRLIKENKQSEWAAHSKVTTLKENTKPYDVPSWMYIEGEGDPARIHKLEAIVTKIKNKEPDMYKEFIDTEWHFVLTADDLGQNEASKTQVAGYFKPSEQCIYVLKVEDSIMWHEFGHYIDYIKNISSQKKFKKAHDREWMNTTDAYDLLTINTSTAKEYFAEMYSYYRVNGISNDKVAPMTKKIFKNCFNFTN